MSTITNIIKDTEQNIFNGYGQQKVEEKKSIEVVENPTIHEALDQFKYILTNVSYTEIFDYKNGPLVLDNDELNIFFKLLCGFEKDDSFLLKSGIFISNLIQNSYDYGNNEFVLDFTGLDSIANNLSSIKGKDENSPLKIYAKGMGDHWAKRTENVAIYVDGNAGFKFGSESMRSRFFINGDTKKNFGEGAKYMYGVVEGNTGLGFGCHTSYSSFHAKKKVGKYFLEYSNNCFAVVDGNIGDRLGYYSSSVVLLDESIRKDPFSGISCLAFSKKEGFGMQKYQDQFSNLNKKMEVFDEKWWE